MILGGAKAAAWQFGPESGATGCYLPAIISGRLNETSEGFARTHELE
jgi:hypothetical protein